MRSSIIKLKVCIILLSIAIESGEGQSSPDDEKVSKGTEPPKHDYPFVVTIEQWDGKNKNWVPLGLGTIYNQWTVFTTATLYDSIKKLIEARDVRIGAGSHNLKIFENTRQYRQPCSGDIPLTPKEPRKNIAVLHLSEGFRFNKFVSSILIPKEETVMSDSCRFGGWGDTTAGKDSFGIISQKFPKVTPCSDPSDKNVVCTTSTTCKGDEGAPLVCTQANRMYAYGIAIDVPDACGSGVSQYFSTAQLNRGWLNTTLNDAKTNCRP